MEHDKVSEERKHVARNDVSGQVADAVAHGPSHSPSMAGSGAAGFAAPQVGLLPLGAAGAGGTGAAGWLIALMGA